MKHVVKDYAEGKVIIITVYKNVDEEVKALLKKLGVEAEYQNSTIQITLTKF